jgi:hypothetical protein
MAALDGSFNENVDEFVGAIDTTGFPSGRHTIFVESKNVNNWGVVGSTFLFIVDPEVSPVIEGYVRDAGTNQPLAASVSAGLFSTSTDPATGFYSMTVISGTYDMVAEAANYAPAYATGVVAHDYETIPQDFTLYPVCEFFIMLKMVIRGGRLKHPGLSPSSHHKAPPIPGRRVLVGVHAITLILRSLLRHLT